MTIEQFDEIHRLSCISWTNIVRSFFEHWFRLIKISCICSQTMNSHPWNTLLGNQYWYECMSIFTKNIDISQEKLKYSYFLHYINIGMKNHQVSKDISLLAICKYHSRFRCCHYGPCHNPRIRFNEQVKLRTLCKRALFTPDYFPSATDSLGMKSLQRSEMIALLSSGDGEYSRTSLKSWRMFIISSRKSIFVYTQSASCLGRSVKVSV